MCATHLLTMHAPVCVDHEIFYRDIKAKILIAGDLKHCIAEYLGNDFDYWFQLQPKHVISMS